MLQRPVIVIVPDTKTPRVQCACLFDMQTRKMLRTLMSLCHMLQGGFDDPCLCSDVTWIIRNNELGGQIAPIQQPLALVSDSLENFSPTGAEGVPNAPLFVPYQVLSSVQTSHVVMRCAFLSNAIECLAKSAQCQQHCWTAAFLLMFSLCIMQADYTFFTGAKPNFPQSGVVTGGSAPSTSTSG